MGVLARQTRGNGLAPIVPPALERPRTARPIRILVVHVPRVTQTAPATSRGPASPSVTHVQEQRFHHSGQVGQVGDLYCSSCAAERRVINV